MIARNMLGLAAVGGVFLGTVASVAYPPTMQFAPLRPWQEEGRSHAIDPVTEPTTAPETAVPDASNYSIVSSGSYFAPIQPTPVVATYRVTRRAAPPPREDLADSPPLSDEDASQDTTSTGEMDTAASRADETDNGAVAGAVITASAQQ